MEASGQELDRYSILGRAQGTGYTILYYATDSAVRRQAIDSVLSVIDQSMSLYRPHSLINRINTATAGTAVMVDGHFRNVFVRSRQIYRDSKGRFDITVGPLVALWRDLPDGVPYPEVDELNRALHCVGMKKVRLKGSRLVKRDDCVRLDMNGIAQGYTVDVLARFLESRGVRHYVIELGGELRVKGPKPDGTPMRIGIERLSDVDSKSVVVGSAVEIHDGAITTAGNYRTSQHVDPATGQRFETDIISATLYARDAMTADGYDNVVMAMNAAEAVRFIERRKGLEAYIVYRTADGQLNEIMTSGFSRLLVN